jgi:hypothetical protein
MKNCANIINNDAALIDMIDDDAITPIGSMVQDTIAIIIVIIIGSPAVVFTKSICIGNDNNVRG